MKLQTQVVLLIPFLCAFTTISLAQQAQTSRIGYAYPAGGQTGTSFTVTVGGKGLNGTKKVIISGEGVTAEFVEHVGNYKGKMREHFRIVGMERRGKTPPKEGNGARRFGEPPNHEMFTRLEELSDKQFRQVAEKFSKKERIQQNREINELAVLKVTITPEATPGLREMRLLTRMGLTNPIRFMVNNLPEKLEFEPNDRKAPAVSHAPHPFVLNGQIMPGDEDKFSFSAKEGENLVIHVKARALVPYLADAVPGWFQAVITISDGDGKEVAYADDFRFSPDPVLYFEVPETGTYTLSIKDSIYRGREDFVYRIAVGELPFITGIFPLGAQAGSTAEVAIEGWNLPDEMIQLSTDKKGRPIRTAKARINGMFTNDIHYAVDSIPEFFESNPNDSQKEAENIKLPASLNGHIEAVGDTDYYSFWAKQGQTIQADVLARQLYSPLDSLVRVFNKQGDILAWNDDHEKTGKLTDRTGLLTHNSDSTVSFFVPEDGRYFLQITDSQNKGGNDYPYRVRIRQLRPDFDLYVTPSSVSLLNGSSNKITVHVNRKDGFEGPVTVKLGQSAKGFSLSGNVIPASCDSITMVLKAPVLKKIGVLPLHLVGSAKSGKRNIVRRAISADDTTQAFITHHLVETEAMLVAIMGRKRSVGNIRIVGDTCEISRNQSTRIDLKNAGVIANTDNIHLELLEAPEGVTLETVSNVTGTSIDLIADETVKQGLEGNVIVGIYAEYLPKSQKNGKGKKPWKVSLGVLPAIPYKTL